MRLDRLIQTLAAAAFGLGCLAFAIAGFVRIDNSERRIDAKLNSIRAGVVQSDALTVLRKYVNPGRRGLPHVVFSSATQPKVDMSVTTDFFNRVNPRETIRGYHFPDGYFIPENQREDGRAGKWFFLGLGVLMGAGALAVARAMIRLPG